MRSPCAAGIDVSPRCAVYCCPVNRITAHCVTMAPTEPPLALSLFEIIFGFESSLNYLQPANLGGILNVAIFSNSRGYVYL